MSLRDTLVALPAASFQPGQAESVITSGDTVIHLTQQILQGAIDQKASDIHIEPGPQDWRIRYRQDSLLYEIIRIPCTTAFRLVQRLKILARLDIAEHRLPQDGQLQYAAHDIRISICPTLNGEKCVLRLFPAAAASFTLTKLGLLDTQQQYVMQELTKSSGMILVTGPTGSGKTTTLYAALQQLNICSKNISTVEDPIEMHLPGITQIAIQPKIGLTFAHCLRALLRQDPDILMVGEIRDLETAQIALQAALTGHLVLSTLHARSSYDTVLRLMALGIATYDLVSAITLIIAQRLIRILCPHCKVPINNPVLSANLLPSHINLNHFTLYRAHGCAECQQGYRGCTSVFEILPFTEALQELLLKNAPRSQIAEQLKATGHQSLWDAGFHKVLQGETSLLELQRVLC